MKKKYTNFAFIDIIKILFMLGIVALHTGFLLQFQSGYYIHTLLFRLGVPFFFLSSGYFLAKKITDDNQKSVIIDYVKKLLIVYLIYGVLNMIFSYIRWNNFSLSTLLDNFWYLMTGRSTSVMWFVGSLIISSIILMHIKKKKTLQLSILIFSGLFIIGLLFNTYSFVLKNGYFYFLYNFLVSNFGNNSNFIFVGYIFTAIGFYFSRYGIPKIFDSSYKRVLFLIFFSVFLVFEVCTVKNHLDVVTNYEYFFSHLFLIPVIFVSLSKINLNINTKFIRDLSTNIYYNHYIVIYILLFINNIYPKGLLVNNIVFYICTIIISIIISIIINKIKKNSKNLKDKTINYICFSLYLITFLYILFSIICLLNNVVWADEIFSLSMIRNNMKDLIFVTASDVHPPLYYLSLKFFAGIVSSIFSNVNVIFVSKLFSMIPLFILISFGFSKIRKYFGKLTNAIFCFLLVATPKIIYYFVEIRMYSWALCFVTIALIYAYEIMKKNMNKSWIMFCIFGILAAYTHLYACLAIGIIYVLLLLFLINNNRKAIKKWIICAIIMALLYLPWLIIIIQQLKSVSSGFWISPITFTTVIDYFKFIFYPTSNYPLLNKVLGIGFFIISIFVLLKLFKFKKNEKSKDEVSIALIGYLSLLITIAIGIFVSLLVNPIFVSRYMVGALGCFILGFSILLAIKIDEKNYWSILLIIPLLISIFNFNDWRKTEEIKAQQYASFHETLNIINEDDIIISDNIHTEFLSAYFKNKNEVYLWKSYNKESVLVMFKNIRNNMEFENLYDILKNNKVYFIDYIDQHDTKKELLDNNIKLEDLGFYQVDLYPINVYLLSL